MDDIGLAEEWERDDNGIEEYMIYSETFDILKEVLKGCATEETISEAAEKVANHVIAMNRGP